VYLALKQNANDLEQSKKRRREREEWREGGRKEGKRRMN
jgi:hypothetical protein